MEMKMPPSCQHGLLTANLEPPARCHCTSQDKRSISPPTAENQNRNTIEENLTSAPEEEEAMPAPPADAMWAPEMDMEMPATTTKPASHKATTKITNTVDVSEEMCTLQMLAIPIQASYKPGQCRCPHATCMPWPPLPYPR